MKNFLFLFPSLYFFAVHWFTSLLQHTSHSGDAIIQDVSLAEISGFESNHYKGFCALFLRSGRLKFYKSEMKIVELLHKNCVENDLEPFLRVLF